MFPLDPRKTCILCGNLMVAVYGKFGLFYSCSAWKKNQCCCSVGENGRPNKKTLATYLSIHKKEWGGVETSDPIKESLGKTKTYNILDNVELD
jgi:hypothetical protein